MLATIEFKGDVTYVGVLEVVISKPRYWQKLGPVILLSILKDTKVNFYYAILTFCLPVRLKVKCDRESSLDTKEVIK